MRGSGLFRWTLAGLAVAALALGGCGGSDEGDGPGGGGGGEKAFSSASAGSISVQALAKNYVLDVSVMYYQDADRPADTGPTIDRLKVLTEQIIGRL